MKSESDVREILIDNTIRLISEGGFEKATTKAITHSGATLPGIKMNEVYIYRLFGSKERLYETAFERLDTELLHALHGSIKAAGEIERDTRDKLREIFVNAWRFVLRNEERCRCYVRYYYSVYFRDSSREKHNTRFGVLVDAFVPLFKQDADVESIMHSVLTTLLDFAIRVYNGDLKADDENTPHVFNVLYCTMASYFKDELKTATNMPRAM